MAEVFVAIALGQMPDNVRMVVERLVAEARSRPREVKARPNGFLLTGGPSFCTYLDEDGEAWDLDLWDESVHPVEDGPRKVGLIAIAAQRVPELAEWLPRRPFGALDCQVCDQTGWLQPPFSRIQCPECYGMGWLSD
jgi:hypothetical protein